MKKHKTIDPMTGKEYHTLKEIALAYGIPPTLFYWRLYHGWTVKDALTAAPDMKARKHGLECEDHLGNKYKSKTARAIAYKLSAYTIDLRLKRGWSLEQALTYPTSLPAKDHLGNEYPNMSAMATAYGTELSQLNKRLERMSLKDALTMPKHKGHFKKGGWDDSMGHIFESRVAMAKAWGLTDQGVASRLRAGWSNKEACLIPNYVVHSVADRELYMKMIEEGKAKVNEYCGD